MKRLTSLLSALALLFTTLPALSQGTGPGQYRVDTINALLQITLFGTDAKVTAWVGGLNARDDGLGGMFFYDGNSTAATNTYAVFKPVNNTGRWWKLPTSVAYQTAAVTVADDTTYAWKLLRGAGATNFLGFGADNNAAFIQTFNGKNLNINNQGNHTLLNATAGNVGIGTTSPTKTLHVNSTTGVNGLFESTGTSAGIELKSTGAPASDWFVQADGSIGGASASFAIYSATAAAYRMMINGSGSVGIGTTAPVSFVEAQGGLTTVGSVLTLGTKEPTVVINDVLGRINFYAPLDTAGTDANLVAGSIATVSEGTFSATSNASSLVFQTGASEVATTKLTISSAGNVTVANGNVLLGTAGNGLQIKEGSNARMGTSTLSGGTIAISNTSAVTGDRIFITRVSGTAAEFGHLSYTINTGVSFTVNSTDAQDDSVINWLIIKPTP